MSLWGDERSRVPIKASVKTTVYKRAKGRCEKCGILLEREHGDFHHTRDPTVSATAKTVLFLCPTCHRKYGHSRTVKTEGDLFGSRTVVSVKRLNPVKKAKTKIVSKKKPVKRKSVERGKSVSFTRSDGTEVSFKTRKKSK